MPCASWRDVGLLRRPEECAGRLGLLTKYLAVEISFSELENKAKQIDQITSKLKDIEAAPETPDKREDLGYIGNRAKSLYARPGLILDTGMGDDEKRSVSQRLRGRPEGRVERDWLPDHARLLVDGTRRLVEVNWRLYRT